MCLALILRTRSLNAHEKNLHLNIYAHAPKLAWMCDVVSTDFVMPDFVFSNPYTSSYIKHNHTNQKLIRPIRVPSI